MRNCELHQGGVDIRLCRDLRFFASLLLHPPDEERFQSHDRLRPLLLTEQTIAHDEGQLREQASFGFTREHRHGAGETLGPASLIVMNLRETKIGRQTIRVFFVFGHKLTVALGCLLKAIEQKEVLGPHEARFHCERVVRMFCEKRVIAHQAVCVVSQLVLAHRPLAHDLGHLGKCPACLDSLQQSEGGLPIRLLTRH